MVPVHVFVRKCMNGWLAQYSSGKRVSFLPGTGSHLLSSRRFLLDCYFAARPLFSLVRFDREPGTGYVRYLCTHRMNEDIWWHIGKNQYRSVKIYKVYFRQSNWFIDWQVSNWAGENHKFNITGDKCNLKVLKRRKIWSKLSNVIRVDHKCNSL